ncbi:MAG: ABC transporter ATP-binding protein [Dehalococcoidia bacterium]
MKPETDMGFAALQILHLSHRFSAKAGDLSVLEGIDLQIDAGSFVSLIGPSGCGKSTLLRCCAGLMQPSAGEVLLGGVPPREGQRRRAIGVVFQDPALLPWRSVRANVSLPSEITGRPLGRAKLDALLNLVGLEGFSDYRPDQLSGGMKQRVALARALLLEPAVLLMDEPFAGLDEISRAEMRAELLRIWSERRVTVLFVTHSIADAVLLSDRVLVMSPRPGRIVADLTINLPRPRGDDLEFESAFLRYASELRQLLRGRRACAIC